MIPQTHDCPRAEALSALIDDELAPAEAEEITAHASRCPVCGGTLRRFVELHSSLAGIGDVDPGVDIAALVQPQLPPREPAKARRARRRSPWQLAPFGVAAAGVLATGVYLGMLLTGGSAMVITRTAPMAVFDAVPPGGLCVGSLCEWGTR